jgi:hypothetical protein
MKATTATSAQEPVTRWGRRALGLVVVGLVLQLAATFVWSPATFILSAAVGLPAVLLGAAVFGFTVLKTAIRDGGPSGRDEGGGE